MMRRHKERRSVLSVLVILILSVLIAYGGYMVCGKAAYPLRYESIVDRCADEYDLPPSLIYAVIRTESHFREDAVSKAGAKGLMQLMDGTYEWIQTKLPGDPEPLSRILEPEINIRCGAKVLAVLYDRFPEPETAVAAYNAGSGTVAKWLKDERYSADGKTLTHIPYAETANYVTRVIKAQERYRALYDIE